uniref:Uncharacterized protein n=1 Tax=Cacopsylla melanoneura TaxID=428564 RepID=A0A8D8W3U3_9HEMI
MYMENGKASFFFRQHIISFHKVSIRALKRVHTQTKRHAQSDTARQCNIEQTEVPTGRQYQNAIKNIGTVEHANNNNHPDLLSKTHCGIRQIIQNLLFST